MSKREIVIRIQLPRVPRKRWLVGGGAAVMLAGVIAYAAVTWPAGHTAGQKLSAADLDGYLNDLNNRSWQGSPTSLYFNGGNVGVGTATPAVPLHVSNGSANELVRVQGGGTGAANDAYIGFFDSAGTRIGYVGDGSPNDANTFLVSDSAAVQLVSAAGRAFTVAANGNVGVGVGNSSPAEALDVHGNISLFGGNRSVVMVATSVGGAVPCNTACGNISGLCLAAFFDIAGSGPTTCSDNTQNHVCLCATHPR